MALPVFIRKPLIKILIFKDMKNSISVLCCLIFSVTMLSAQSIPEEYNTAEKRAKIVTDKMIQNLPLRNSQLPAIKKLNLKYAQRIQKEIIDPGLGLWSSYFKMKEINDAKEKELLPLLSTSQKENYIVMKQEARSELWAHFF